MAEIDIGMGKSGRRGYSLDEVAIVPSRRTRDADEVDLSWQVDAYQFDIPVIGAAMDGVTSPDTAIEMGRLGGLGVLHLEGLWCRHRDPAKLLEELASTPEDEVVARLRELHDAPIDPELIGERVQQIRDGGATVAVAVTPSNTESLLPHVIRAEPDLLVIQGTVTSAEHVSEGTHDPLDLKHLVRRLEVATDRLDRAERHGARIVDLGLLRHDAEKCRTRGEGGHSVGIGLCRLRQGMQFLHSRHRVEVGSVFGQRAGDLVHEHCARDPAPTRGVGAVFHSDVIVDDDLLHVQAFRLCHLGSHVKVHQVACVVRDDHQHAGVAGGLRKHLQTG